MQPSVERLRELPVNKSEDNKSSHTPLPPRMTLSSLFSFALPPCGAPYSCVDVTFLSVHLSVMLLCLRLHSLFPSSPDVSSEHLADVDASSQLQNKPDVPSCCYGF